MRRRSPFPALAAGLLFAAVTVPAAATAAPGATGGLTSYLVVFDTGVSGTASVVSRTILQHCSPDDVCHDDVGRSQGQRHGASHSGQPLRILDLACGGGDVTLAVSRKLAAAGLRGEISGVSRERRWTSSTPSTSS